MKNVELLTPKRSRRWWLNFGLLTALVFVTVLVITLTERSAIQQSAFVFYNTAAEAEILQSSDYEITSFPVMTTVAATTATMTTTTSTTTVTSTTDSKTTTKNSSPVTKLMSPSTNCPQLCEEEDTSDIYFLELSSRQNLSLRELCALESASIHNPKRKVILYSLKPMNMSDLPMKAVLRHHNTFNKVLNLTEMFEGTPLEVWNANGSIADSSYPVYHLSDALRLAVLWKNGGAYLDTDVITLCPLNCLPNALGLQLPEDVANGVLFFEKFNPFLNTCMHNYASDYHPEEWGHQGPVLVTNNLKKICNGSNLASVINKPELCRGIRLMPQQAFLPIPWTVWQRIFTNEHTNFNLTDSYMVHLYGFLSRSTKLPLNSGTLMEYLAKTNCPETYRYMMTAHEV